MNHKLLLSLSLGLWLVFAAPVAAESTALAGPGAFPGPGAGKAQSTEVARTQRLRIHSDPWINLHHFLYQWGRAEEGIGSGRTAVEVPEREDARRLDDRERAAWTAAVDFYRANLADLDHFDGVMLNATGALRARSSGGALPDEPAGLADHLRAAMDVYRDHWWPEHDGANRRWWQGIETRVRTHEPFLAETMERAYGGRWDAPLRVDVSAYANWQGGYTSLRPDHTVISSTDEGTQGIHGLEILFHEASHQLSLYGPSRGDIEDAFAEAGTDAPRNLWHAVIFSTVGWAVQQIAQEEGLRSYVPSAEALRDLGVWEELWPALDAHWRPFLEGQVPREEALVGLADWFTAEPPAAVDPWANLDEVRSYLDDAATEPEFSGVVLIGRGDDVVFERAYGFADMEHRVPMRTGHRFRLGSLTKPITASAVLVAVDRGLLALDAKACRLLPSCPRTWQDVTVRHLLTHSSGIPDHFGDLDAVPVEETVEELRHVLGSLSPDEPLRAAPGAEYEYSNFNYVLLGALLEAVVGAPWEDVLRELVFEPLGLRTMAYDDVHAIMEDRVRGYERGDTLGLRNIDYDDHAAYAAGGLLSDARDVFRWFRGMLNGELFSSRLVRESLVPYRGDYGYGWQIRRFFDRDLYNHTGGIDGFSSHLAHYPDDELTILVLTNVENDSAILRACDLAARLFDWPVVAVAGGPELTPRQRCGLER